MKLTYEQLQIMPKVELHLHLDGSVRPQTLVDLANKQKQNLPTNDPVKLKTYMMAPEPCEHLNQYLETFDFVLPFMQTVDALERVAYELVEQCAEQNVKYVEVRFAPQLHREQGLSVHEVYEHVYTGLHKGEQEYGVVARMIGICLRGHSIEQNKEVVEAAKSFFGKGLVAVDLAGAEALYPPELYDDVFHIAKEAGMPITIHAGEAGGAENVSYSVHHLGAARIGHGVRLKENKTILNDIKYHNIPLELCPISNLQTKAIQAWEDYPLLQYMNDGLIVTVNTDNLTVSNTTLTKELWTLQEKLGLTAQHILMLQHNAVNAIFLEEAERESFTQKFMNELQNWSQSLSNHNMERNNIMS